ncbi:MAG: T9SS type A sorting domain-containing protein [Bacteroidota bacterium]
MSKKVLYLFISSALCVALAFAGSNSAKNAGKAPRAVDAENANSVVFNTNHLLNSAVVNYAVIDTMANSYGPAIVNANPISFDPYSNSVVIVHRSKASYAAGGSGGIFYAYSTDGGTTWNKRVGPMQAGLRSNGSGRYPSISLHNPSKTQDPTQVFVQSVFPVLVPQTGGSFGGLVYSTDGGVGVGNPVSTIDSAGAPWSSSMVSPSVFGDAGYVFAAANYGDAGHISIFSSTDGITFAQSNPAQLAATEIYDGYIDDIAGLAYQNGAYYIGVRARFATPLADTAVYTLGVSKSTDGGATWSALDKAPYKTLVPSNYVYNIYANDFVVDGNGGYHWLAVSVDTAATPDLWTLHHIYKASGGSWTLNKIKDLPTHENWAYGDLDQTLTENQLSVSQDGNLVVAKWIQDGRGATYSDSLPIADVWTATWKAGTWSASKNLTNTPDINDQLTHIAQFCGNDGKVHLMRSQSVVTSGNVGAMDVDVTAFYYANDLALGVRKEDGIVAGSFTLGQNYPNPFNPSTTISFTLPNSALTTLKVYNMVGQEVASLVEGQKEAGMYVVDFDASKLASGIYLYKLQSGSYVETKKMVLIK